MFMPHFKTQFDDFILIPIYKTNCFFELKLKSFFNFQQKGSLVYLIHTDLNSQGD